MLQQPQRQHLTAATRWLQHQQPLTWRPSSCCANGADVADAVDDSVAAVAVDDGAAAAGNADVDGINVADVDVAQSKLLSFPSKQASAALLSLFGASATVTMAARTPHSSPTRWSYCWRPECQ